jgi:hypothetical protein
MDRRAVPRDYAVSPFGTKRELLSALYSGQENGAPKSPLRVVAYWKLLCAQGLMSRAARFAARVFLPKPTPLMHPHTMFSQLRMANGQIINDALRLLFDLDIASMEEDDE